MFDWFEVGKVVFVLPTPLALLVAPTYYDFLIELLRAEVAGSFMADGRVVAARLI